jgi:hypothetical protein
MLRIKFIGMKAYSRALKVKEWLVPREGNADEKRLSFCWGYTQRLKWVNKHNHKSAN